MRKQDDLKNDEAMLSQVRENVICFLSPARAKEGKQDEASKKAFTETVLYADGGDSCGAFRGDVRCDGGSGFGRACAL